MELLVQIFWVPSIDGISGHSNKISFLCNFIIHLVTFFEAIHSKKHLDLFLNKLIIQKQADELKIIGSLWNMIYETSSDKIVPIALLW